MKDLVKEIKKYFNTCDEISAQTYKCVELINNQVSAVYIIDLSGDEVSESLLNTLNDDLLPEVYYSYEGDTQWNLYYIKVLKEYKHEDKKILESSKLYARKYLYTPEQLYNSFKKMEGVTGIDTGLYDVWCNILLENNLGFVIDESRAVSACVREFMEERKKRTRRKKIIKGSKAVTVNEVNEILEWDRSRLPVNKIPEFRRINLITGANASGKTSMLEFIELGMCGDTRRNPGKNENKVLKIRLNDNQEDILKNENSKYIQRDVAWYSANTSSNKTSLLNNFSRYNFFDSDASYRISNVDTKSGNGESELNDVFEQIALGRDLNALSKRLDAFISKFNTEKNKAKSLYKQAHEALEVEEQLLKDLKKVSFDPVKLMDDIFVNLSSSDWKAGQEEYDDPQELVYDEITFVIESLDELKELIKEFDCTTVENFNKKLKKEQDKKKKVDELYDQLDKVDEDVISLNNEVTTQKKIFESLKLLDLFDKDKTAYEINDHANSRNELSVYLKELKSEAVEYSLLDYEVSEKYKDRKFLEILRMSKDKKSELLQKENVLEEDISNIKGLQEINEGLIGEIKEAGLKYIENNSESDECPMCGEQYSHAELVKRIQRGVQSLGAKTKIIELEKELKKIAQSRKKLASLNVYLRELQSLYYRIFEESIDDDYSISVVIEKIEAVFDEIKDLERKELSLDKYISGMGKKGLTVNSFVSLENDIKELVGIKFSKANHVKIMKYFADVTKKINNLNKDIKNKESLKKSIDMKIDSFLEKEGYDGYSDIEDFIDSMENSQGDIDNITAEVNEYFSVDVTKALSTYYRKIIAIKNKVVSFEEKKKLYEKNNLEREKYQKSVKKWAESIKLNHDNVEKLSSAISIIEDIQITHSKDRAMSDFFDRNIGIINDIYLDIHSPKEFKKIDYNKDLKKIILTRFDNREYTVTEISSGQRAAIALSIFLTLNRNLSNGPNIMMFDDPVIFADDLNVLSFFDYLRRVAVETNRQIFFATANAKIANLFQRKFSVFSEEFTHLDVELIRNREILKAS